MSERGKWWGLDLYGNKLDLEELCIQQREVWWDANFKKAEAEVKDYKVHSVVLIKVEHTNFTDASEVWKANRFLYQIKREVREIFNLALKACLHKDNLKTKTFTKWKNSEHSEPVSSSAQVEIKGV